MRTRTGFLFVFALALSLFAQNSPGLADKRIALVIGNADYVHTPVLANPRNDAADVAQALTAVGFDVTLKLDLKKQQIDEALEQFGRAARTADAALFYYAGHGMQYQGKNYLMPVDAELQDELSLRYEMTAVDDVKAALQLSPGVKVMVLDACRNNPLADKFGRSITLANRGLAPKVQGYAPPEKSQGMIIVFATQADDVAEDGAARNSPFSEAFLKEIKEPGVEVGTMFRRIGRDVYGATKGQQSPELSISMVPEYTLNQAETDQTVWARIRSQADVSTLREFLDRYPNSFYAPDARDRLDLLQREAREKSDQPPEREKQLTDAEAAQLQKAQDAKKAAAAAEAARIASLGPAVGASPADRSLVPSIEAELRRVGCYAGVDGDWDSPPVRLGVTKFARYAKLATPAAPDSGLLDSLKNAHDRVCPPECSVREVVLNGRCVTKACPRGELLSRDGVCYARPAPPRPAPTAHALDAAREVVRRPAAPKSHCFNFNGSQYCE